MRLPSWLLPPLCLLPLAGPAPAADCDGAGDQAKLNACAAERYGRADAALNQSYRALLDRTDEAGRASLREAESRWIAFRDAQCDYETMGSRGGSVHPFVRSLCLADLTEVQAKRLARQAHCEEGDLSCAGR